jgi:triosephosphate isomerase
MLVAGNWKMNLGLDDSRALATALAEGVGKSAAVEVAVFPQVAWLLAVREEVAGSDIGVGAQNGHPAASGAFTGEVSIATLAPHCRYILAGHSERRHIFGESDAFVGEKVQAILAAGCRAILCVGETLAERRAGEAQAVVERQLAAGLDGVTHDALARVTIAYEPVWAIGTGVAATPQDAQAMCAAVRGWIDATFGRSAAEHVRVLYGGSVSPDNAGGLFALPDVDGGLVGGASLKPESFLAIVAAGTASL